jgi:hypothetical protein
MGTEIFLNDLWSVYFHNPISDDWERTGYIKIADISTVQEYWQMYRSISPHIHNGMWFVMREHIFPSWDDPLNKEGSFLSFKVLKSDIIDFSKSILIRMLGETMFTDEHKEKWASINGVSFSPKKNFCIIKIWFQNQESKDKAMFNLPENYQGDVIFKDNYF